MKTVPPKDDERYYRGPPAINSELMRRDQWDLNCRHTDDRCEYSGDDAAVSRTGKVPFNFQRAVEWS
jgi:hypothetical protein